MKAFSSKTGRHNGANHSVLLLLAVVFMTLTGRAETLLTCTNNTSTGDRIERGFYVPAFPGNSLDSARLVFSSPTAGSYTVRLTVRSNAYDGIVLGSDETTFTLASSTDLAVMFNFSSIRIRENSRVCFLMTEISGPSTSLFYGVNSSFSGGCPTVVETEGTTPPIDTFRRNGVNLILNGQDTLIVAPGETIQAAIDAASVGDTVYVDPGTYTENLRLRSGVNVVGSGFATTILRGVGNTNVVTSSGVTNSRFEGFKITRNGNNDNAGVVINGGSLLLNNNWITGNRNGVRINGGSPIIRNNIIDQNGSAADGLLNYGVISLSATPLIANNLISSNTGAGIYLGWAASAGTQVINNTVDHNTDNGIWCYNGANALIKNNIFTHNSTGISASHGSIPLISFNDVWGNNWLNYDSQSGGVANPGPGDISADPRFDPAVMDQMRPYFKLMAVLSEFGLQLMKGTLDRVTFGFSGAIAHQDCSPLTVSGLAALLNRATDQPVNMVNAGLVAERMGLVVEERKSTQGGAFSNLVTLTLDGAGGSRVVSGTLFEGSPRIVGLRDYAMDFMPEAHMLLLSYLDRPGMIGKIGTVLGKHDINIAFMSLGRREKKGEAMVILSVDSPVPPGVVAELKKATEATFAQALHLPSA